MPKHKKPALAAAPEPANWTPLPPPRENRPLLAVSSGLVLVWIAFLLYLALMA